VQGLKSAKEIWDVLVGTMNQGYPLLQYEGTVPVRQSLAAR
jgi:hypothetical protein